MVAVLGARRARAQASGVKAVGVTASRSPLAGRMCGPVGRRSAGGQAARALGLLAGFFVGVAVGLVLERDRPFGARYWQAEAEQAWRLRDLVVSPRDDFASRRARQLVLAREVESAVRVAAVTFGRPEHPDTAFFGTQM